MVFLSCFPSKLYGRGGFYDPEVALASIVPLEAIDPALLSLVGEVHPGTSYGRPMPAAFGSDPDFVAQIGREAAYLNERGRCIAPCIAVRLREVLIAHNVLYRPAFEDVDVLYESFRDRDRPWTQHLPTDRPAHPVREFAAGGGVLTYLGSAGSLNYGHFLVDDLPRLMPLLDSGKTVTILLPSVSEQMDAIRIEAIQTIAPAGNAADPAVVTRFVDPGEVILCRDLTYVTPATFHPHLKHPAAMQAVRNRMLGALDRTSGSGPATRLFVTRSPARYRRLLNAAAVASLLGDYGFVTIDPEEYGFAEQVALFADAQVVVGTMGAAMTNTLFARTDAALIYLAPTGWQETFFWDLASVLGQRYCVIYGPRQNKAEASFYDDFTIDLPLLRQVLETRLAVL